jgi:hypothetical protein
MWEAFELAEDHVPLSDGLIKCTLAHSKAVQSIAAFFTAIVPSLQIHVLQCQLIGKTWKCSSLSDLKDFSLGTKVVGVSTLHYIPPTVFTFVNGL